ncbi:MAG: UDP-2,3-diacylglucosamine diphosphatase LpxI [Armatimonadota bacterium]|nr:UDP-2,3-diacylglucosamine diphosphatase LpxI [Armatimonadota bacterium]MDR7451355.1 UDP-2,3-diacylglucosamine diphosphatase LpxI [Armatimonadota bacterium]MDR7466495.1 UDP-2,3-diacylglucosamine diphosphatase LpxI [Armatimonadota bacterium]MDR7493217.1 UDP-2,3-diacylglucosamine diphosphatase LpxI [Armatimonadota bacterium]MDR7499430.1 UDP-2,3-diacylglucosamine diphosphatase LpxI [Armatimonadota bacterium]
MGGRDLDGVGVVGLIAGEGRLPVLLAQAARAAGCRVVAVTVEGDGADLAAVADESYRAGFGEFQRIIAILTRSGVRQVIFAGRVSRARLVAEGDTAFRARVLRLGDRGDQTLFQQVAVELLGRAGITVASPLKFVAHLLVEEGVLTRSAPTEDEARDARAGLDLARKIAALDVGQTVVLRHGAVLAVEAAEGTDEAIRRGGKMAPGVVVAKAARPHQDDRFDLPAVGLGTLETMAAVGARVLAVEAGATLLLDRDRCLEFADRSGIAVVGLHL